MNSKASKTTPTKFESINQTTISSNMCSCLDVHQIAYISKILSAQKPKSETTLAPLGFSTFSNLNHCRGCCLRMDEERHLLKAEKQQKQNPTHYHFNSMRPKGHAQEIYHPFHKKIHFCCKLKLIYKGKP